MAKLIKTAFFCISLLLNCFILSQSTIIPNKLTHPLNRIFYELESFNPIFTQINETKRKNFNLTFNMDMIRNNGHSNIDNNGNLFAKGTSTQFLSFRVEYKNKYLFLEFEPYFIDHNNLYSKTPILRNGFYLNIIFVLLLLAFIYVQDLPIILISLSLIIISHMTYLAEYIEKVRFQAFSSLIAFALTILFVIVFSIDDIYKIISLNVTLIYITLFLQLYYFEKKHTNYYWK